VTADAQRVDAPVQQAAEALAEPRLLRQQAPGVVRIGLRQPAAVRAQRLEHARRQVPHRLVDGALVERRHPLGGEGGVLGVAGQRQVQLAGPAPEQADLLEERAEQAEDRRRRRRALAQVEQRAAVERLRGGRAGHQHVLVEALEAVEGPMPGVALVGHPRLQEAHRHGLAARAAVLEEAGHRRDLLEGGALGEEAPDLEVRIDALGEPAEQLQHEPVPEDDRGVALLAAQDARRQLLLGIAAQRAEGAGRSAHQLAGAAAPAPAPGDAVEPRRAQRRLATRSSSTY
jgi:hypothetical protein